MKKQIIEILNSIDEEICEYEGDNLFNDGLLDSLMVIDLVAELNETFDINITAKYIIEDNFKTIDDMVSLVNSLLK